MEKSREKQSCCHGKIKWKDLGQNSCLMQVQILLTTLGILGFEDEALCLYGIIWVHSALPFPDKLSFTPPNACRHMFSTHCHHDQPKTFHKTETLVQLPCRGEI